MRCDYDRRFVGGLLPESTNTLMDLSARQRTASVLSVNDPEASRTLNSGSTSPILLVCDHASNRIPERLDQLGLEDRHLQRHIAYDKGSEALTEKLCQALGYAAVLCNFSRLVIDCNRRAGDPTLVPEISDDVRVPGNHKLNQADRQARYEEIYVSYHRGVKAQLDRLAALVEAPALVAIHSFTPKLKTGDDRPWHVGVLWDKDPRIAQPLLDYLRQDQTLCVGDNEPYSGKHAADYTIDHHGEDRGLPCVSIEVRQDLLNSPAGVHAWAQRLTPFFKALEKDGTLYTRRA